MESDNFIYLLKKKLDDKHLIFIEKKEKIWTWLYYDLCIIPNEEEIKNYNNDNLKELIKIYGVKKYIEKLKKKISKIDNYIPLFDMRTDNIYLIEKNNVFYRVTQSNYRHIGKKLYNWVNTLIEKLSKLNLKEDNNSKYDDFLKSDLYVLQKYNKMKNFMDSFNMLELKQTYYKLFFLSSNYGKEMTACKKNAFYIDDENINPYYKASEIINIALNQNLISEKENYNITDIWKYCWIIQENDINMNLLLWHQDYITNNNMKNLIFYYWFFGWLFINKYLRNDIIKDVFMERIIENLWLLLKKTPVFEKKFVIFRFIKNDNHYWHLNIGDLYLNHSFISCSRNPFYLPKSNVFGNILEKITLPKNIQGIGLALESYSLFRNEEEILLMPCKLKLISKDNNFKYYHPNKKAQNAIKKKYEFEIIDIINYWPIKYIKYLSEDEMEIPIINFLEIKIKGRSYKEKIFNFFENYTIDINGIRKFYTFINNEKILFNCSIVPNNTVYDKFFYLINDQSPEILYLVWQNEDDGANKMSIEINEYVSVNYFNKFIGMDSTTFISDENLVLISWEIAFCFDCKKLFIHGNYNSYINIINKTKDFYKEKKKISLDDNYPDIYKKNLYSADITYYCIDIHNIILNIYERIYNNNNSDKNIMPNKRFSKINGLIKTIKHDNFFNIAELKINDLDLSTQHILKRLYIKNNFENILQFYFFIHNNYFYLMDKLQSQIWKIFQSDINIFGNIVYSFDPYKFLYSINKINNIPKIENIEYDIYDKIKKNSSLIINDLIIRKDFLKI